MLAADKNQWADSIKLAFKPSKSIWKPIPNRPPPKTAKRVAQRDGFITWKLTKNVTKPQPINDFAIKHSKEQRAIKL